MSTQCEIQAASTLRDDRDIRLDSGGGQITADAGLIALREFDHRIGFTESIAACLDDGLHPCYVRRELAEVLIRGVSAAL